MNVVKSYACANCNDVGTDFVLNKLYLNTDKYVGKYVNNQVFNTAFFCEDSVVSCLSFGNDTTWKVPYSIVKLVRYIKSLYEEDFRVSSVSIYESRNNKLDVDIVNAKTHEVYTYRFKRNGVIAEYDDYYPESSLPLSIDEQYFPYVESDEPDKGIISELFNSVLSDLKGVSIPVKRIVIFSIGSEIDFSKRLLAYKGVGSVKNYYGLQSIYDEGQECNVVFNTDDGEYDICFLVVEAY